MKKIHSKKLQQLQADVLRLRYGVETPVEDAMPFFSMACIARYLKKDLYVVRLLVNAYFRSISTSAIASRQRLQLRQHALQLVSTQDFLESNCTMNLEQRVAYSNLHANLRGKKEQLTVYHLRKHYNKLGIKRKVPRRSLITDSTYTQEEQTEKLKALQQDLLEAY